MNKQKQKQQNANKHNDSDFLSSLCPLWPQRHPTQLTTLLHQPNSPSSCTATVWGTGCHFSLSKTLPPEFGPFQGQSKVVEEAEGVKGGLRVGTRRSPNGMLPRRLLQREVTVPDRQFTGPTRRRDMPVLNAVCQIINPLSYSDFLVSRWLYILCLILEVDRAHTIFTTL